MIARVRGGDHEQRWDSWRPRQSHQTPDPDPQTAGRSDPAGSYSRAARKLVRWLVLLVVAAVAYAAVGRAGGWLTAPKPAAGVVLPATPRAWLDGYEAAAVDDPARVCSQLFAAGLAAVYAHAARGSCRRYFAQITSSSVTVRRVLYDGDTAVLELHQVIGGADWDVVLDRRLGGWQAVDVRSGRLVR